MPKLPNCCFPTDNPAEIPVLRLSQQADFLDQPVLPWGGQSAHWRASRASEFRGTWHFYVEDAKFSSLRHHPDRPLSTAAPTLVEPNFSLDNSTPFWLGLEVIGRKRWISRFWQSQGRRILVDLHVPEKYQVTSWACPRSGGTTRPEPPSARLPISKPSTCWRWSTQARTIRKTCSSWCMAATAGFRTGAAGGLRSGCRAGD